MPESIAQAVGRELAAVVSVISTKKQDVSDSAIVAQLFRVQPTTFLLSLMPVL